MEVSVKGCVVVDEWEETGCETVCSVEWKVVVEGEHD